MFKNKKTPVQIGLYNGEEFKYEPDSSPEAWAHFKNYYSIDNDIIKQYDLDNLRFYTYLEYRTYSNCPDKTKAYNRLYALHKNTEFFNHGMYCRPALRLSGDCDFNFNEKKYQLFKEIIMKDTLLSDEERSCAMTQLSRCKDNHDTLLNFSLMQSIGDMQKVKGKDNFDRFDKYIRNVFLYLTEDDRKILSESKANTEDLMDFLNEFKNGDKIYDYFKTMYFIDDHDFVDNIIEQGALPINTCKDVIRYMTLAEEFWNKKEFFFLKDEFLTIDSYFEDKISYTEAELLNKLESDFGIDSKDGQHFLEKCVERNFITETSDGEYTR